MIRKIVVALGFTLFAVAAQAQVVPSTYVPFSPCALVSENLTANTTSFIAVRGACNVPETANAVALLAVTTDPSAAGSLKVGDGGLPISSILPVLYWKSGTGSTSSMVLVRLCYPYLECSGVDLVAQSTTNVSLVLRVIGYFEPAD